VPVFAEFSGGLGVLLGPTGGYLISYPIATAVVGRSPSAFSGDARASP
jgi:biotin transport system substrate-specific component